MAWLPNACNLLRNLFFSIDDAHSVWWSKFEIALQKIETDLRIPEFKQFTTRKVNEILFQQKQLWIINIDSPNVEQILKCMLFHGNNTQVMIFLTSDNSVTVRKKRSRYFWIQIITSLLNYCCVAFGKFHLMLFNSFGFYHPCNIVLIIEFSNECKSQFYENMFWNAFYNYINDKHVAQKILFRVTLGFLMVFGKKCIGNMLANKSQKELQKKIVEIWSVFGSTMVDIDGWKLSEELMSWCNIYNIEKNGNKFIYQDCIHHCNIFDQSTGWQNFYFLYGKLAFKAKKYVSAKCRFVHAIDAAPSFFIIYLSLRYLSKICKLCGEYGMGLKCLKRAHVYKLLYFDNKSQIFEDDTEKGFFKGKLNKMTCSNCGMKKGIKLRSCSGCMKAMYCNRKCQKLHWKRTHRITCDTNWSENYNVLKNTVIFTVKN